MQLIEMAVSGDLQAFVATLETAPRELANYLYPQSVGNHHPLLIDQSRNS